MMTIKQLLEVAEKERATIYKVEDDFAEIGDFIFILKGNKVVSRQKSPMALSVKSYVRGLHK